MSEDVIIEAFHEIMCTAYQMYGFLALVYGFDIFTEFLWQIYHLTDMIIPFGGFE